MLHSFLPSSSTGTREKKIQFRLFTLKRVRVRFPFALWCGFGSGYKFHFEAVPASYFMRILIRVVLQICCTSLRLFAHRYTFPKVRIRIRNTVGYRYRKNCIKL
jgi:hypothetical protein